MDSILKTLNIPQKLLEPIKNSAKLQDTKKFNTQISFISIN
jgi:hypothetical protein